MPVHKYPSVEDMPRIVESDAPLADRIRAVWNRGFLLSPPSFRRGVSKFRTIEEANAQREADRAERLRARRDCDR